MKSYYNLPKKVIFCKKCVLSNQRPASISEFMHTKNRDGAKYLHIDSENICDACKYAKIKDETIDWEERKNQLIKLLDKKRKTNGDYDCIVPGSGGKDSIFQSHILKYKYGMNPLTITWPPIMYTEYGYENFKNWIEIGGFDNISFKPNGVAMRLLTKLSIENLLHPFQTFILGQKNLAPKIAKKFNIDLIFYGENEAEYGNPLADNSKPLRDKSFYTIKNIDKLYLAGMPINEILKYKEISLSDIKTILPLGLKELENSSMEIHYLGYYLKWIPQEAYYYAVEKTNFKARPFRTEGTYSKYSSIDDKIDDLHYYTTYIKFGLGRASYDASQELRNKHLTREEAISLVNKYDGERPYRYIKEVLDYIDMSEDDFFKLCDNFRSPHLWEFKGNDWVLRNKIM